jgi:hypothetical protein
MRFININERSDNVLIYEDVFEQMSFLNSKNKIKKVLKITNDKVFNRSVGKASDSQSKVCWFDSQRLIY